MSVERPASKTATTKAAAARRPRARRPTRALGIDIGGSGIKAAPVDVRTGELLAERVRIETPDGARPADIADVVAELVKGFAWTGPIGCGFPAVVKSGITLSAANVHHSWIGYHAGAMFSERTGLDVVVANDADVAGLAEMRFGSGARRSGVVFFATLGTGIGTALFNDGQLVPNLELGHIEIRGKDAEERAAASAKEREKLTWKQWAERLDEYIARIEVMVSPDLIILGGGVSAKADKWLPLLKCRCEVVAAEMANQAGIVGAALVGAGIVRVD